MAQTKYTRRPDDSGWLMVLLSGKRAIVPLCEYTELTILRETSERVFFRIADGNSEYVGEEASLRKENATKFLSKVGPGGPASVRVKYGVQSEEVSPFQGRRTQQWGAADFSRTHAEVTLNSVWGDTYTPILPGNHRIMAPDRSHSNQSTR